MAVVVAVVCVIRWCRCFTLLPLLFGLVICVVGIFIIIIGVVVVVALPDSVAAVVAAAVVVIVAVSPFVFVLMLSLSELLLLLLIFFLVCWLLAVVVGLVVVRIVIASCYDFATVHVNVDACFCRCWSPWSVAASFVLLWLVAVRIGLMLSALFVVCDILCCVWLVKMSARVCNGAITVMVLSSTCHFMCSLFEFSCCVAKSDSLVVVFEGLIIAVARALAFVIVGFKCS